MKAYIAYKFKDEDTKKLRKELTNLDKTIKSAGFETFIFFRDEQKWGKVKMTMKDVVERAKNNMNACDIIIAETSEKARGVDWEIGFFQGQKKPVIVIAKENSDNNFLAASTPFNITYKNLKDLKGKLTEIRRKL